MQSEFVPEGELGEQASERTLDVNTSRKGETTELATPQCWMKFLVIQQEKSNGAAGVIAFV